MDINQNILRIQLLMNIQESKEKDTARWITCKNCNKKFTQTIHRGRKSTTECPHCGTHDAEEKKDKEEIKERCWKGYTQKGMKTMFGKKYPNCVKKND